MKLPVALFSLLSGAGLLATGAAAQPDEDCTAYGDDAIAARACVSRHLEAADQELAAASDALRELLLERGAVDGRRDAGALEVTTAAWRNWRDAECALSAALSPQEPLTAAPLVCAVDMTRARVGAVEAYAQMLSGDPVEAPAAVAEAPPTAPPAPPPAPPEPTVVAEMTFSDWGAQCLSDGACEAATRLAPAADAPALRVTRASLDGAWSIQVRFTDDDAWSDQVALRVDAGEAIRLDEWDAAAVLELMKRGLSARAIPATDESEDTAFSLRGLTASMNWIDDTQIDARRTH